MQITVGGEKEILIHTINRLEYEELQSNSHINNHCGQTISAVERAKA